MAVAVNSTSSTLMIPLVAEGSACPELSGQLEVADPAIFGLAPLTGRLSVKEGPATFKLDFLWPDDFSTDDTFSSALSSPSHP